MHYLVVKAHEQIQRYPSRKIEIIYGVVFDGFSTGYRGFHSSGIWRSATGWLAVDISRRHSRRTFWGSECPRRMGTITFL